MNVSAIVVTRGDVDMQPVLDSLPDAWQKIVWCNGDEFVGDGRGPRWVRMTPTEEPVVVGEWRLAAAVEVEPAADLSVYGRYAAIEHASHDLIYVQDDDCIVSDPQAIVDAWGYSQAACAEEQFDPNLLWRASGEEIQQTGRGEHVVCNMPERFRHDFYTDHALVGFGAAFHRDAPARAFARLREVVPLVGEPVVWGPRFRNTCDVAFTGLTPRVLVDVEHIDREFASDDGRMWRQPSHVEERQRMRELVAKVRDAN